MTRYQLAKLVQWAGTLRTRKRLQKVVFLLKTAGFPFDDEFSLHYFGPYSSDVAERTDEMTNLGLLEEQSVGNVAGQQYNYTLTGEAQQRLASLEATPQGQTMAKQLTLFKDQAKQLLDTDVRELEVAATIVYFRQQGCKWSEAVLHTCSFKGYKPDDSVVKDAEALARTVLP